MISQLHPRKEEEEEEVMISIRSVKRLSKHLVIWT
jgi:hypothetical protein